MEEGEKKGIEKTVAIVRLAAGRARCGDRRYPEVDIELVARCWRKSRNDHGEKLNHSSGEHLREDFMKPLLTAALELNFRPHKAILRRRRTIESSAVSAAAVQQGKFQMHSSMSIHERLPSRRPSMVPTTLIQRLRSGA